MQSWGPTILRVVVGTIFIAHGWQKLFVMGLDNVAGFFAQIGIPMAGANAVLVSSLEFFGGILLVAGLFTRWISVPLAATMVVAIATVHAKAGFFLPNGYEFPLLVLAGAVSLVLTGAGEYSLDNWLAARRGTREVRRPVAVRV